MMFYSISFYSIVIFSAFINFAHSDDDRPKGTFKPSNQPSKPPVTIQPSGLPSSAPSLAPVTFPPSTSPSVTPITIKPSFIPSLAPITTEPSYIPSSAPVTTEPSYIPSVAPITTEPSYIPSFAPITEPSYIPSLAPITTEPSNIPSFAPVTTEPSYIPSFAPVTTEPSYIPSFAPMTTEPSYIPSLAPITTEPSYIPSLAPVTTEPSYIPSLAPITTEPSYIPSFAPVTTEPSFIPSFAPVTTEPSYIPSTEPTIITQNNNILALGQQITSQCTAASTLDSSATTTYTATFQVQQSIETSSNGMTGDGSDAFTQTAECFVGTNVSIQSTTIVTRRRLINNLEDSTTKSNKMSTQSAVVQVTYDVLFLFTALSNQNITAEMLYAYYNLTNLILDNTQNSYYTVALYYYCSFYANCLNDPNVLTPTFSQPVLTSTVNDPVLSPTTVSAPSSSTKNELYTDSINAIFASPAQATAFVVGIVLFIAIAGYCFVYFFGNTCSLLRNKRKHKDPIVQDIWQIYAEDYHKNSNTNALKTSRPHNSSNNSDDNNNNNNEDDDDNHSVMSERSVILNFYDTYDNQNSTSSSGSNMKNSGHDKNNRSSKNSNKNNNNNVNDTGDDAIIEMGRLSNEARESLRLAATLLEENKEFRYSVTPTKINNSNDTAITTMVTSVSNNRLL